MSLAAGVLPGHSQNALAIQVDAPAVAGQRWVVTALVDPNLARARFSNSNTDKGDIVALMQRGQIIVAETGANPSTSGWLPAIEQPVGLDYHAAAAPSRTGATFSYATQPALGSDFYILSRFDNSARQSAWLRAHIPALAPLIMLATLYFCIPPGNSIGAAALDRWDQSGDDAAQSRMRDAVGSRRRRDADRIARALCGVQRDVAGIGGPRAVARVIARGK